MSAPNNGWQMMLGIFMSLIIGHSVYDLCFFYGVNHDLSLIVAGAIALLLLSGFYFLLEAAMMENEGMSIQSIYKEFFGERK